jgi:hypothetical protein
MNKLLEDSLKQLEECGTDTDGRIGESAITPNAPNLTLEGVIPNIGSLIGFAGGEGEAGFINLQRYMTAEQIQALLNFRGAVLTATISESDG